MSERWARVEADMIRRIPASAPARVLLTLLSRRNQSTLRCDPSIPTIMADSGLTKSGVLRAMSRLEEAGIVERVTAKGRRTAYRLITGSSLRSETSAQSDTGSRIDTTNGAQSDTTTSPRSDTKLVHDPTPEQTKNSEDQQTSATAAARAAEESEIERAWRQESPERYPGVHNWDAFVTSKIRKGEMPTAYLTRLRRQGPQTEWEAS